MYRLLIVDDEADIRESIANLVDWNSLGYVLVNSFGDAESAIEYISENPIDVILTDIIMTGSTGIDIAKFVYKNYPEIKVIILSGYGEFEYARESINNNVYSYLLKPTDPKELFKVFTELKNYLDKTGNRKEIDSLYKEQFVHNIVCGNCDSIQTERYVACMSTDIDVSKCFCAVFVFEIKNYSEMIEKWKYEKELFNVSIVNFIEAKLKNDSRIICTEIKKERINVVGLFADSCECEFFDDMVKTCASELCCELKNILKMDVGLNCYFTYKDIYEMSSEFFKDYNCGSGGNMNVIDMKQIIEMKKELVTGVFSSHHENRRSILENYIKKLSEYGLEVSKIFINDIFVQIYEVLIGFGINEIELDFGALISAHSCDDLLELSFEYIQRIRGIFQKKDIRPQIQLVENAKKYIYENYNKDISLSDVSDAVFVSSTYLSRVFKKVTGVKFIDFLTDIRIKKAKELLRDSQYKIYDICVMLGYKNPNYFVTLFQKNTGMTPLEYRKFNS